MPEPEPVPGHRPDPEVELPELDCEPKPELKADLHPPTGVVLLDLMPLT